jgi:hypothetical protein
MPYGISEWTISQEGERMNGANKVTVGWVIGVAIVLLLIGLSVYTGYGKHPSERTPSAVTQPQK